MDSFTIMAYPEMLKLEVILSRHSPQLSIEASWVSFCLVTEKSEKEVSDIANDIKGRADSPMDFVL